MSEEIPPSPRPSPIKGEGAQPPPSSLVGEGPGERGISPFESKVLAYFIAAGLVVAVLAGATWKQAQDATEAALHVSHTHEVLVSLARTRGDTVQIELSTQNHRLTGDPARLAERDAAMVSREAELARIRDLTADHPRQQARWKELRATADERLAIARKVTQLRQTEGEAAAAAYVATAPLRETQERIFGLLGEMQDEERRLLQARSAEQARARALALAAAMAAALALAVLLGATFVVIRRQLRANEAARRALLMSEAELRRLNESLDRANRTKSDFLASMSHELRTPLNAIIGFSEILRDGMAGDVSEQQREYLQDILSSGTHLLDLINDILDLSKVEAGKMTLELESLSVASLLKASLAIVREKAASHRLTLDLQVAADAGEVCADARKAKQIVYNLLSNAVKFTPDGGRVALSARRVPLADVPAGTGQPPGVLAYLEITVADSGIGISAEDRARLFSAFTQIDSSLSRQYEGTGLGLALVKRLAELHGGAVGVESEVGKGSTFRVWLPYRPAADCLAAARRHSGQATDVRGGRVLVVEDDAQAFEMLRLSLAQDGFTVTRAADAQEARAKLEAETPDLVTLDILLPGEDGWQFLDWMKRSAAYAHIPVVVVSIVAEQGKGFSLGASAVLQKPFLREDLSRALAELGFGAAGAAPRRILVIDDDPAAVEHAALLLEAEGHTVERACGGREGVAKALADPPDLVILDLMMPDLSGFEVVTVLRTDSRTALTPIVVVTGKSLSLEERAALNGHVLAVVAKSPFSPGAFLAEVRRALSVRGAK
ncbi:MAG: response regulator [Rhodocyclales bacterium]|nr:response regulator [Rhodocyclales bacterium]